MSGENWWQGPRSSGQLETNAETSWPELSSGNRRPTRRRAQGSGPGFSISGSRDQARSVDRTGILNKEGYPELGQKLSKRKLPGSQTPKAECSLAVDLEELALDAADVSGDERRATKFPKRPKRTDLICIDLKKVLERQRSLSESQTTSSPKQRVRFNLNVTVRNPLDSTQVIQSRKGKQAEVPWAKRISKLKKVILSKRESRKRINRLRHELFDLEKLKAMTKNVDEIDFDRLKISADSARQDVNFAKNLSSMTFFYNNCKKPGADDVADGPLDIKNDVTSRLENLLIQRDDDIESETFDKKQKSFLDSNIVKKIQCPKICDETGETVEELEEPSAPSEQNVILKSLRHSRNFREYCTNDLTPGLNTAIEVFLSEIYRLQRRMYEKNEVKGRSKRRYYAGFKEVQKHIESKRIKFVVIAPDLEGSCGCPDVLEELVDRIIAACKRREIVYCFALNKRKLGYYTHKKGSVSCVGVTNYFGLEENFENVLKELTLARDSYKMAISQGKEGEIRACEDVLLSTRINLLFKNLAIAS